MWFYDLVVLHFSCRSLEIVTMHPNMKDLLIHFVCWVSLINIAIKPGIANLIAGNDHFSDTLHKVLPGNRCDSMLVSVPHMKGRKHACILSFYLLQYNLLQIMAEVSLHFGIQNNL